ncbi:MAG: CPBP family intramembrane metalloprotease [Spirochaetales bacterium]|nr:CPBP family intramembrane metalloprotease [Spirochaetales bacterium]
MPIRTLFLDAILVCAVVHPAGLPDTLYGLIVSGRGRGAARASVTALLCAVNAASYAAACALVFAFAPELFALRVPSATWFAAALGLAAVLPALETGLEGLTVLARTGRFPARVELAEEWRRADPAPAYAMAVLVAIGEELLLRLALFGLLARLGVPPAFAVAASAIAYGLNHARSGFGTVLAKTASGAGYALVFLLSGGSVLASAACHACQNVLVLAALSRRKARDA